MTFDELLAQVKKVPCEETRTSSESYLEVVVNKNDGNRLASILESYFGPPFKPGENKPSEEAWQLAESHGGIWPEQTMYFRNQNNEPEVVLLWPWGSGDMITVKIIRSPA